MQWRIQGRGPGSRRPPLIFGLNWGPKGRKKFFGRPGPPLSKGLDDRPPSFISRSGSGTEVHIVLIHFPGSLFEAGCTHVETPRSRLLSKRGHKTQQDWPGGSFIPIRSSTFTTMNLNLKFLGKSGVGEQLTPLLYQSSQEDLTSTWNILILKLIVFGRCG